MDQSTSKTQRAIIQALTDIAPELANTPIDDHAPLREAYDLDSADFLRFLMKVHDVLSIDIPESDYDKVNTLSNVINYAESKLVRQI